MDGTAMRSVEKELRAQCEALDPDAVPLPEVAELFEVLDRVVRLASGAKLRLLRRVEDPAWVARSTGTSVGAARDAIETSRRLLDQRGTDEALARGALSEEQARAISDAAVADPLAERALLDAAGAVGVRELKHRCAETKANAHPDPGARREAIRRGRCLRTFRDVEGAWNLHVRHLPEVGAEIEALLAPFTHRRFEAARDATEHEPHAAYRADGLLDLARAAHTGGAVPKGARRADTKVIVHVDHDTLVRGRTSRGSVCHIDGIGPVDVEWVREVFGESFAAVVVEDIVGVRAVAHLGRQVTAHQRTALEARGHRCEVPGCGSTLGLEIDHVDDWAFTKRTVLDDLAWLCRHHHRLKTTGRYRLAGPPGDRTWRERRERPPPPAA